MNIKISNFAKIIVGYPFRKTIRPDKNGNIWVLQANNVNQHKSYLTVKELNKVSIAGVRPEIFLQKDDVVLVSRGLGPGSFRAMTFLLDENNIIASSTVYIIRITDKKILPKYLSLYLNSSTGQRKISKITSGAHLQIIPRKNIDELEIPIPDIDKQQIIINLYDNIKKQEQLNSRKIIIYKNIINNVLNN